MKQVFVDTDVIFDLLSGRQPFVEDAAKLFSAADIGTITIFISSLSFSNLNYILTRQYNANEARKKLLQLKTLVQVLAVTDKEIELALSSNFNDFEDAIQYFTATAHNLSIFITRNVKDYKTAIIPIMSPKQFLSTF